MIEFIGPLSDTLSFSSDWTLHSNTQKDANDKVICNSSYSSSFRIGPSGLFPIMPWVRFELTIPLFECEKTSHVLDRVATVIGYVCN
jgi:hypothetical protein